MIAGAVVVIGILMVVVKGIQKKSKDKYILNQTKLEKIDSEISLLR